MTKKELTYKRDLYFNDWVRKNLPDSSTGFWVTDVDFVFISFKSRKFMLVETKKNSRYPTNAQSEIISFMDTVLRRGTPPEWEYLGYHVLVFEKTGWENGKVWLDGKEITEEDFKYFVYYRFGEPLPW
jgi:hypothetical protein